MMHSAIASRLLTDTQPDPTQQSAPPGQLPSLYTGHDII